MIIKVEKFLCIFADTKALENFTTELSKNVSEMSVYEKENLSEEALDNAANVIKHHVFGVVS